MHPARINTPKPGKSFQSKPCIFFVGKEREQFYAHETMLGASSVVFRALLDGPMKESRDGIVYLPEVEPEDFDQLLKFFYRDGYDEAEREVILAEPPHQSAPVLVIDLTRIEDDDYVPETPIEPPCPHVIPARLPYSVSEVSKQWEKWKPDHVDLEQYGSRPPPSPQYTRCQYSCSRSILGCEHKNQYLRMLPFLSLATDLDKCSDKHWKPQKNRHPYESFRPVFFRHARLYILADMYDVQELRELAQYRLYHTLAEYSMYIERISDLLALSHELYANTAMGDPIRRMIVYYFLCFSHCPDLRDCAEYVEALRSNNDFAADLVIAMMMF
ncbi:BTB domain-containing protein [Fusarium sp. LHS14.1]|nr:BTB domain-containing protein [Fusarium sp. LHS14.1]